jgi:glycosyltransferase involved in cell wall biosynthesis
MKIIYIINAFNRGGAEIGLLTLLKSDIFAEIDLQIIAICQGSGEIYPVLYKLCSNITVLNPHKDMKLWMMPISIIKMMLIFNKSRPDAVILSLPQANICGRIAAKMSGVRNIISFEHNTHLAKNIYETLFRITSNFVTTMLSDSTKTGQLAARRLYRRPPPTNLVVPLVSFPPPPPSKPYPTQPRIVSVGRLTSTKNHQAVIRAIALLRHDGIEVHLDILGEGPLRSELETLKKSLGVNDLVSLPGFIESWHTHSSYSAFVLSSHHEGLCIVALEAMHSGIPVITPIVGGMADYVSHQNATILQQNTPECIAGAIAEVLSNLDISKEKSNEAREMVETKFGTAAVKSQFKLLNQKLLAMR